MRGGARPGAGRKKLPVKRQVYSFRLFENEYVLIKPAQQAIKNKTSFEVIFDTQNPNGRFITRSDKKVSSLISENPKEEVVLASKLTALTADQEKAYRLMMSGANCFITGGAGAGKSYVLEKVISDLRSKDKQVMVCAPTGIAARNIGGTTLHHAFGIPTSILEPDKEPTLDSEKQEILDLTDVIIIDEVSMVRVDVFESVMKILERQSKPHTNSENKKIRHPIQLILCGDYCQLPPIINTKEREVWGDLYPNNPSGFAFLSSKWQFDTIELKEIVRQKDEDFAKALNQIRLGDPAGLLYINANRSKHKLKGAITLAGTNRIVNNENSKGLNSLKSMSRIYKRKQEGQVSYGDTKGVPLRLTLKVGAQVVLTANGKGYVNGQLGTVKELKSDSVIIELDDDSIVEVERTENSIQVYEKTEGKDGKIKLGLREIGRYSQLLLKLGYAITIHRSQGQTYDRVNLRLDKLFASGQLYVALSRCKTIEDTYFYGAIDENKITLDDSVREFYQNLS